MLSGLGQYSLSSLNQAPSIDSLIASPDPVTQGDDLTLTANSVSDSDGTVVRVEFYRDSNGNGAIDVGSDAFLGTDASSSGGWAWSGSTAGWQVGSNTYMARALDDGGAWSNTATTTGTVGSPNQAPSIDALSGSPDPVTQGSDLTLTASGVSDSDGTVVRVEFYRDSNGNGAIDVGSDAFLGTDMSSSGGWAWSGSTGGWQVGSNTYMARAVDDDGAWSNTVTTTGTVAAPPDPSISINDVTVKEAKAGRAGTTTAEFTVSLSAPSLQTVTVHYDTADGSATAGNDYQAIQDGTVTFPAGETRQTIAVTVYGDSLYEGDESFQVVLSSPTNATLGRNPGTCVIQDDDKPPKVRIDDVMVDEGATSAVFNLRLATVSGLPVSVDYATANRAALAGTDYTAVSGTATIPAGSLTCSVSVPITDDALDELNETFRLNLSNAVGASLARGYATATIVDNDLPPTISVDDISVTEPASGLVNATFTVRLSAASGLPISVHYATANGTAKAWRKDYQAAIGTLTFDPGVTEKTVSVSVLSDVAAESDEVFYLNLSRASHGTLLKKQGACTIHDRALLALYAQPGLGAAWLRPGSGSSFGQTGTDTDD